ncbi:MAG TPA: response regulator [Vicinamibacterales bacterium]|nr:response regulator [Vicinamibacterales bacterium]
MSRPLDLASVAAFSDEVRVSAPAIVAALDAVTADRSDALAAQEAYRLLHALKGAAWMVGLPALGYLLNRAEDLTDRAITDETPMADGLLVLLRATADLCVPYVEAVLDGRPTDDDAISLDGAFRLFDGSSGSDDHTELTQLLATERQTLASARASAEPAAPGSHTTPPVPAQTLDEVDPDLVPAEPIPPELAEVFAEEARENLEVIARITGQLTPDSDDRESLRELRRSVHTIKGAAGVIGYQATAKLAHRMEDLLDALYEGTAALTPDSIRLLVTSSDGLDEISRNSNDPVFLTRTLRRLLALYDGFDRATPAPPITEATEPAAVPAVPDAPLVLESPEAPDAPAFAPTASAAHVPDAPRPVRPRGPDRRKNAGDRRAGGAQIARIPFERLGDLLRAVSELLINRSSFDQHYAALVEQVDEVKLSASRLRRIAQKLETDYEVRAMGTNLARLGARDGAPHGFDELEFDRYNDFHLVSRELTETASDINTIGARLDETVGNFDGDMTRLGRLTREVQDKVMEFRMVPLAMLAPRLDRTVRVTCESCAKSADLVLEGDQVALDKALLESMADPLLHLLRNAIDHGIEAPGVRIAHGKSERGRVIVRAAHDGTDVLLEIADDGAGLDLDRIRSIAVERGYVTESDAAALTDDDLSSFIFEPGFSTASHVTEVSGRGVGLDVVKATVARLGGRIRVSSQPGRGMTVSVRVPMTLAITRILLVRCGGEMVGLPLGAVVQIIRSDASSVSRVGTDRVVTIENRTYPLRDLAGLLGLTHTADAAAAGRPILVANLAGRFIALAVDEIVQSRDAVVKTLGSHLRRVSGIWGATLLGDGTVVLILNPTDLAAESEPSRMRLPQAHKAAAALEHEAFTVMVVDDSLSMRHVLSNAVKRAGWNALQARDGLDALEQIERAAPRPDLVLLDIEMPRMDGYEFLSTIRTQAKYASLPVVMLTSRGGDKHREKAMSLGATDYVVKPFQEDALIEKVDGLIRASRGGQRKAS